MPPLLKGGIFYIKIPKLLHDDRSFIYLYYRLILYLTAYPINKFNTSVLRQLNQAKAAAAASGGTYGGFTIAQWEDLINDYSDVFSKEVANQGLLSNDAISALSDDVRNDLKDIIVSAQKLRGAVQDNMTSDFVKNANITPEFISENNSIDIRSEQISDLKDNMKQASTDIGIALAQKRNEEKKKSDDNH